MQRRMNCPKGDESCPLDQVWRIHQSMAYITAKFRFKNINYKVDNIPRHVSHCYNQFDKITKFVNF